MQKVLLTGSTGFLGTKFIDLFRDRLQIKGIARSDSKCPVDLMDNLALEKVYKDFQPDIVIHAAADLGRDASTSEDVIETAPAITRKLIQLALETNAPFIFTSTEAVYGGKECDGGYVETDPLKPRSPYGKSKVASERIIQESGLPFLIIRSHRFVGISKHFNRPKQFPDALTALLSGRSVSLDSVKLFTPTLINHICDVFWHYIQNDLKSRIILNVAAEKQTTFFEFMKDVLGKLGVLCGKPLPDGEEVGWPLNSTLSVSKLRSLRYPTASYNGLLDTIRLDAEV